MKTMMIIALVLGVVDAALVGVNVQDMREPLSARNLCTGILHGEKILVPKNWGLASNLAFTVVSDDTFDPFTEQCDIWLSGTSILGWKSFVHSESDRPFTYSGDNGTHFDPYVPAASPFLGDFRFRSRILTLNHQRTEDWEIDIHFTVERMDDITDVVCIPAPDPPTSAPTTFYRPSPHPTAFMPTPAPSTPHPSAKPTDPPTHAPTEQPTDAPTPKPSQLPTSLPTSTPTSVPSPKPTNLPSSMSTGMPTGMPTPLPTPVPSPLPTALPTSTPTSTPTSEPTSTPTSGPTSTPTPAPSGPPTSAPTSNPTGAPTSNPTEAPTSTPTAEPTATPTMAPTQGTAEATTDVTRMYIIEDNDPTNLQLELGYGHMIWENGTLVEPEVYFHGTNEYNIAVEVSENVATLELEGYFHRYRTVVKALAEIDYNETLQIYKKTFTNVDSNAWYGFLDGSEQRSMEKTNIPNYRLAPGFVLLEAGEFHLTATPYDIHGNQLGVVDIVTQIRANPSREPIFNEGLMLEVEEWKDIKTWQEEMRTMEDPGDGYIPKRAHWDFWRLSQVTYFKSFMFICHEKWGVIWRVLQDEGPDATVTSGMETFLDVKTAVNSESGGNSTFGLGSGWHSGLRSVAFHPLGDGDNGRMYVTMMEKGPTEERRLALGEKLRYIERGTEFVPVDEDSVIVEFQYEDGKGLPNTYRLLFRIEMPIYDHSIRQLQFGPDEYLYVLHGDGSVEDKQVGHSQLLDGLGKIYRLDPLDGTGDLSKENVLEMGQYSTFGNPYHFEEGEERPMPALPGPIDHLSENPWANPVFGPVPKETYAIGFRNPHQLTFTKNGDLIVGEAGRDTFGEVNVIMPGGNYGWPYFDGTYVHTQLENKDTNWMFYSSIPVTGAKDECSECGFRWPAVSVGHVGFEAMGFNSVALVGGHAVENDSPVGQGGGKYFYCDFPITGKFYYSYVDDLLASTETSLNPLPDFVPAQMYHAGFIYKGVEYETFRDVSIAFDESFVTDRFKRVDVRLGRDNDGAMYILSKTTGKIFKVTNSAK